MTYVTGAAARDDGSAYAQAVIAGERIDEVKVAAA